jgi:hypothetical protein
MMTMKVSSLLAPFQCFASAPNSPWLCSYAIKGDEDDEQEWGGGRQWKQEYRQPPSLWKWKRVLETTEED